MFTPLSHLSPAKMARFKSRKDRIHHALRLYHGIGCEEHSREEIAEELDVRRTTVDEYLDETPQADEIRQTHDAVGEMTRNELIMDKRDRLRQLRELEEELRDAVEVVVTGFEFKDVELEVDGTAADNISVSEDADATYMGQVPVPKRVKEVPQFKRLRAVWNEMRQTEEELATLMGLNEPEEVNVTGNVTEQKFYKLGTDPEDEGFPEQEVQDLSEEDSV